jgi:hypothetical protein
MATLCKVFCAINVCGKNLQPPTIFFDDRVVFMQRPPNN